MTCLQVSVLSQVASEGSHHDHDRASYYTSPLHLSADFLLHIFFYILVLFASAGFDIHIRVWHLSFIRNVMQRYIEMERFTFPDTSTR